MLKYLLYISLISECFLKSKVFYIKKISSKNVVKAFKQLNITLEGKVGLKVHTGEIGGRFYLHPNFLQDIYDYTNGTYIECNAAYTSGKRYTTELHQEVLDYNGWLDNNRRIQIMDEFPSEDFNLTIPNCNNISNNIVGGHLQSYNSCLVLAHFKGHAMGGFGGALKQLSIGFASRAGKANIHSGGYTSDYIETWSHKAEQDDFTGAMADAASSIVNYFRNKGGQIAFINVMSNISIRCDCGAGAPDPKIRDLGILASLDPVAIDKAAYDLIVKEDTEGAHEWLNNSIKLLGTHTIMYAEQLGIGSQDYELIEVEGEEDDEQKKSKTYLYVLIPIIVIVVLVLIVVGVFMIKKKSKEINNGESLGVSLTKKD